MSALASIFRRTFIPDSLQWYSLFFVLYVLLAFAGRALTFGEYHFTPIWFSGAVYIIFLLNLPYKKWIRLFVVAALAHLIYALIGPGEFLLRLFFFLGRSLDALTGAFLFRRFVSTENRINTAYQSVRLIVFTCFGSSILSALFGTIALRALVPDLPLQLSFPVWWSGDAIGLLIILPLYLGLQTEIEYLQTVKTRLIEIALFGVILVALLFFSWYFSTLRAAIGNLLIFPLFFYVAYRFRLFGLSAVTIGILILTAFGKVIWPEFFIYNVKQKEILFASALSHLAIQYVVLLLFVALVKEREKYITSLTKQENTFRLLAENSRDIIYRLQIYPSVYMEYISPAISLISGYSISEFSTKPLKIFSKLFQLEKAKLSEIFRNPETLNAPLVTRWVTKSGDIIWVEQRSYLFKNESGRVYAIEGTVRDISAAKENELLAVRRGQRLQLAENVARLGSWDYNPEKREMFWSEQLREIYGADKMEIPSIKGMMDRVPYLYRALAVNSYEKLKREQIPYVIEHPILRADGSELWVESKAVVIADDDNTLRIIGSLLDISQRVAREGEISRQNEMLTTIFDSSPYIMILVNRNGDIIKANKEVEGLLCSAAIIEGSYGETNIRQCIKGTSKEHRDAVAACESCPIRTYLELAFDRGELVSNAEAILYTQDTGRDEPKNMLISTSMVNFEDKLLLFTINDISGQRVAEGLLKESENRFRFIADNIEDVIWKIDTDFNYTYISKADEKQRGYLAKEVIGTSFFSYLEKGNGELVEEFYQKTVEHIHSGGRPERVLLEFEQVCKNGVRIWTEVVATPDIDDDNTFCGFIGVSRDTTDRRRYVQNALEHAELYHQMFQNHSATQLLLDAHTGMVVDANLAAVEFYGYSMEQFKTISISKLNTLPPEGIQRVMKEGRESGKKYFVVKHRLASGEIRDVEVYTAKIKVHGRELFYSIVHDITARQETARQLEESEKKYKTIFEQSADIVYRLNSNGIFESVSPAVFRVLGYKPEELIGRNLKEFLTPASFTVSLGEFQKKQTNKLANPVSKYEVDFIGKNGEPINLEINSRLINNDHGEPFILGMARDVTDRKRFNSMIRESESRFKSVWNQSVDGMRIVDDYGIIIMVNDAFCKLVGLERSYLEGKAFSVIYHEGDNESMVLTGQSPIYAKYRERINDESIEKIMERKVEFWNGRILWLEISNSIIKREGDKKHVLSIFRDITERKKVSFELEQANQVLEEHIQTKNKFLSILSHDLRGPFHGFLGISRMLSQGIDDMEKEDIVEAATELHKALNNQFELLNELLEWSKLQTGRMRFNPEPVLIKNEVMAIREQYLPLTALKEIQVHIFINEEFTLFCDANMMRLLLRNTLSNAIKFSHPSGKIHIAVEETAGGISLVIEDFGVGIPPEIQKNLFSLNKETTQTGTAGEKGSGLGLILCKEIMSRHGGQLVLESEAGRGTKVNLIFPALQNPLTS